VASLQSKTTSANNSSSSVVMNESLTLVKVFISSRASALVGKMTFRNAIAFSFSKLTKGLRNIPSDSTYTELNTIFLNTSKIKSFYFLLMTYWVGVMILILLLVFSLFLLLKTISYSIRVYVLMVYVCII